MGKDIKSAQKRQSNKEIVIFGCGGFGRLAHVYFSHDSPFDVVGFSVHEKYLTQSQLFGLEVVPFEDVEKRFPPDRYSMFVAVGYENLNMARANVYRESKRKGYKLVNYISSKSSYWEAPEVGDNSFIFENNAIHPFVRIGNNVIIGSGNHIGHDTVIDDHCFIAGHVMIPGAVRIGPYCFLGANSTLRDGISIGERSIIGAGTVIQKSTNQGEVYIARGEEPVKINSSILAKLMHSPFFRQTQDKN